MKVSAAIASALMLLCACAFSSVMADDQGSNLVEMYEARLNRLERLLSSKDDDEDDEDSRKSPPPSVKASPPPTSKASPPPPPKKNSNDDESDDDDDDKSPSSAKSPPPVVSKSPPPSPSTRKAPPPPPPSKKNDKDEDENEDEDENDDDDEKEGGSKVKGDPHFTGADDSHFDFSGVPNTTYCLMSDSHFHVNAYLGGYYGQYGDNPSKALTWIRKVGVMWGHHTFLFEAREGAEWRYGSGYMARMEVDGDEVVLSQAGDSAVFADGAAKLTWEAAKLASGDDEVDVYVLSIAGVAVMRMELRPEVANLRLPSDGTVHFDLSFEKARFSSNAHGILGQTYRPDHKNRLSTQKLVYSELLKEKVVPGDNAEGFLDGSESVYRSSHLLQADCQVSRFARAIELDTETAMAIEMSVGQKTGAVGSSGIPRKMLFRA